MKAFCRRVWQEDQGVLTFEWVLLITVLAIGIVGGMSAVRDALVDELGDVVKAAIAVDQSYTVTTSGCNNLGNAFRFTDTAPYCPGNTNRYFFSFRNQTMVRECGSGS